MKTFLLLVSFSFTLYGYSQDVKYDVSSKQQKDLSKFVTVKDGKLNILKGVKVDQINESTLRMQNGADGPGGTWSCVCISGDGTCKAFISSGSVSCGNAGTACSKCDMDIVIAGLGGTQVKLKLKAK